ncbi:LysR substrate-binding domain-containing protein [Microvirga guangxiensis]|uniref:Transcriptional regulator, LysR family n=1 Tax=Microvirga guangxiensis TaxID=549386 RepID=A0A1G5KK20_9HYPH|nr:LysR substrate-binding domain-containing protein [Microvirga guangxiensis]SCZ00289.1 transcriptional regulator, LysR family [Microvirga guangxiensis]
MHISHRHLQAFQAVILTGGFTKAARLLRTSQPAISRLIKQLQDDVGFSLFARIDGHTVPTAEGQLLYQEVERSFHGLDKIIHRASQIKEQRIGHLRIVSMPALAQTFLPRVLSRFLKRRPGVMASLQVQRSETIAASMTSQQFDIGFAMLPFERPGLDVEVFDRAAGVCVLPKTSPLAQKPYVEARDLAGASFIGYGPNSLVQRSLERVLSDADVAYQVQVETPITAIACQLVKEGLGVTIADPFTAETFAEQGLAVRPFLPEVTFNFGVFYPANSPRSSLVLDFFLEAQEERQAILKRSVTLMRGNRGTRGKPQTGL